MKLNSIQFVHCAIPNMSLSEADTSLGLGNGTALASPIAVRAASDDEAEALSISNKDVPAALQSGGTVRVFLNGRLAAELDDGHELVDVGDGLEAAKALRMNQKAIPSVDKQSAQDIRTFVKQLRIAMFLTDSKSIGELERAPIYRVGD